MINFACRCLSAVGVACVALLMASAAFGEPVPPPRLIQKVDPEAQAKIYRELFEKTGLAGLDRLTRDKDTSLALQASWEGSKRLIVRQKTNAANVEWTYDPVLIKLFINFLEKRADAPVPKWWSEVLMDLAVEKGDFHLTKIAENAPATVGVKLDGRMWHADKGTSLQITDKNIIAKSNKFNLHLLRDLDDKFYNSVAAVVKNKYAAAAVYDYMGGYSYRIRLYNNEENSLLWASNVWALARGGTPIVNGRHRIDLHIKNDRLFVFGTEFGGMYTECFDLQKGKCQYRFCTSYWGDYSEKWKIK